MKPLLIVIDSLAQWAPYYKTDSVVSVSDYLQNSLYNSNKYTVINLCSNLSYLSEGYFCSLLAQARGHKILPSAETLNQLNGVELMRINHTLQTLCPCRSGDMAANAEIFSENIYFGKSENPKLEKFAKTVFDHFPAPLLRIKVSVGTPTQILHIRPLGMDELDDNQQSLFADSLDQFSSKVWRKPKSKKVARYDLAIFHNPNESMPPSNKGAIKTFISEAKKLDINAELITENDSGRLLEYDALFIRATTAVNDITYKLAVTAEQADMVVIDDPTSIIRCTNKVYLKEMLENNNIPSPKSQLIFSAHPVSFEELQSSLGDTVILKIPDGSFSIGIEKVSSAASYETALEKLFYHSSVLLAQEYVPTEFDWRIGVLNGDAIYGCHYYMARGHWQIYNHGITSNSAKSGRFQTFPIHKIPRRITRLAEKAANCVGRGLYGVDIKETKERLMIIEVNDNPSIDQSVEDKILGAELYRIILREFTHRLRAKHN